MAELDLGKLNLLKAAVDGRNRTDIGWLAAMLRATPQEVMDAVQADDELTVIVHIDYNDGTSEHFGDDINDMLVQRAAEVSFRH